MDSSNDVSLLLDKLPEVTTDIFGGENVFGVIVLFEYWRCLFNPLFIRKGFDLRGTIETILLNFNTPAENITKFELDKY